MAKGKQSSKANAVLAKVLSKRQPSKTVQARLEKLRQLDVEKAERKERWLTELIAAKRVVVDANRKHRAELYRALQAVYRLYLEIEFSGDLREEFYNEIKQKLIELGSNVQKNTRDAALLIRWVFGDTMSNSRVHKYVSVLHHARDKEIDEEIFSEWLEKETINSIVQNTAHPDPDIKKQRMQRARLLLLQYLEWRETRPFASQKMLAWSAERYLGRGTDLCVMIGTAVRRFDRESDYADIHISHILPPNLGLDIKIIDRWARYIEPQLERLEAEREEKTADEWGDDLNTVLWNFDVGEAEKIAQYWQLRQQAALAEDQHEFVKTAKHQLKKNQKK